MSQVPNGGAEVLNAEIERPFSSQALENLRVLPDVAIAGWLRVGPPHRSQAIVFVAPAEPIGFKDEKKQTAFANHIGDVTGLYSGDQDEWRSSDACYFDRTKGLSPAHLTDMRTPTTVVLYPGVRLAEVACKDQQRYQAFFMQKYAFDPGYKGRWESPLVHRIRESDSPEDYDVKYVGYKYGRVRKALAAAALWLKNI